MLNRTVYKKSKKISVTICNRLHAVQVLLELIPDLHFFDDKINTTILQFQYDK